MKPELDAAAEAFLLDCVAPWAPGDELERARERLKGLLAPGWVRVEERLPEEGQEVLVWSSKRQACFVGYRMRGVEIPWFWRRAGLPHSFISRGYGTHWQELPPGPGSEEEEKP